MFKLLLRSLLDVALIAVRSVALLVFGAMWLLVFMPYIDLRGASATVFFVGVAVINFCWNRPLMAGAVARLARGQARDRA